MKLLSVKILGDDFRSLASNTSYIFNITNYKTRLSNKVFAGLNGSGKSNLLELFSEIFYYLEIFHFSTATQNEKSGKNIGFEIEYFLPKTNPEIYSLFISELSQLKESYISNNIKLTSLSYDEFENLYNEEIENEIIKQWNNLADQFIYNNSIHVRIIKELNAEPKFSIKRHKDELFINVTAHTQQLLPKKVIAYTSGDNELLSNPFYKIKYHYFKEQENSLYSQADSLIDNNRLFFVDYNANFSIFVANMLLAQEIKLKYLTDIFKIDGLDSFRITINLVNLDKTPIQASEYLKTNISKLKLCATVWIEKKSETEDLLILDYNVTDATKLAFKFHFANAFTLFKAFYTLETLNLHLIAPETRELILKAHKSLNLADEINSPDPSRLIFRIEKIVVRKIINESTEKNKTIYYKGLSDGEHQFNEVVGSVLMMEQDGCLFLLDEPDTHFNPMWRAKLIETLNFVTATHINEKGEITSVRNQEIIITTHSPFVISDSLANDVYRFQKKDGVVSYKNPDFKTYGASISIILEEIFEKEESISEMAKKELKKMIDDIKSVAELRIVVDRLNSEFGESSEKFDLFGKLRALKLKFDNETRE